MASYTATSAKHATLGASTVDTVTLGSDCNNVEVYNRAATVDIYFTVNGATPTVAGDNTYAVGPGTALLVSVPTSGATVVKLISTGANAYSVTGT
jgi:hypothetical protein